MRDAQAPPHLNFASDNAGPVHPAIMEALADANTGHALPYGADPWTARAVAAVREVFEAPQAEMRLVPSGIAANALALSCLVGPWHQIYCSEIAHIECDELGAVSLAAGGAALHLLPHTHGKVTPEALRAAIQATPPERRGALSLTQATEAGTLYTPDEIADLTAVAREKGLAVHLDGARWSNAAAALGCAPAEITWRAGVDALSLGATKAGLLGAEAVVFFDPDRAREVDARRLRMGLCLSKQRFLAAQLAAWLRDGLWCDLAERANAAGARLSAGLAAAPGVTLDHPTEANMVFARLPRHVHRLMRDAGALYYLSDTHADEIGDGPENERLGARFVCDWSADAARVDALLELVRSDAPA